MTKKKFSKRALLVSILSLLTCMTMLIGSTFAWFTDSVTSSGNIIKSGTLDVTMEWRDATATGKQLTYKDASEGAIFNNDKWEPGYVEAKNVKISNVGTLALQYNLTITASDAVSALADVIDVYYAEGEYTLADRTMTDLTKVGTLSDVLAGMPTNMTGDLAAEAVDTVTIALKMQETANNDYQDLAIGSDFSVVLMATQDNVEMDSFDENYDDIVIPEMDIQTINGVTYGTATTGDYVMISVDDYSLTSFTVDNKVTILGTGNGVNDNDRVFGKDAPLTSLSLPEGLVEIKDNALNALPNLTTVNLPSTLKTIGIQSFRDTGMSELSLPENIETVKLGAFRDMKQLTTVTVEGNVNFDDYAFRSCPNLTSIYLLGDDVTFTGNQFATHSDNGDANGITIYVKNATVAARVYAAQTSAYGYEVKILGAAADGSDAQEVPQVKDDSAFDAAITGGTSAVVLGKGNYSLPDGSDGANLSGKELTVVGTKDTVIDVSNVDTRDQFVTGATMVFDGVTLNFGTADYMGFANTKSLTYKNCNISGYQHLYGPNVSFENCTFTSTGYTVCTYGAEKVSFTNCEFNTNGKCLLLYKDDSMSVVPEVSVKNCVFNASTKGYAGAISNQPCAAIEIHNYATGVNLTTSGNTIDDDFSGEWRIKQYDNGGTITINGTVYTQPALDGKLMNVVNKEATFIN